MCLYFLLWWLEIHQWKFHFGSCYPAWPGFIVGLMFVQLLGEPLSGSLGLQCSLSNRRIQEPPAFWKCWSASSLAFPLCPLRECVLIQHDAGIRVCYLAHISRISGIWEEMTVIRYCTSVGDSECREDTVFYSLN